MIDLYDLDEDEKQRFKANVEWLAAADPDDWHRVALDFNWDEPLYLLYWIVQQDNCDIATALDIFWKGQPTYWLAEEGEDKEKPNGWSYLNRKMCIYIANRVRVRGYRRSEIAFSPDTFTQKDYVDLAASEMRYCKPNIRTHSDLIRNRVGRKVDLNGRFYRRYPEEFHLSFYDEEFSDALEQGLFETRRSAALARKVEKAAHAALRSFPAWLKPQLDNENVESEAMYLFINIFFIGFMLTTLFTGRLTRFGPTMGWIIGSSVTLYLSYLALSHFQTIRYMLNSCGLALSKVWLATTTMIGLISGSAAAYLVVGPLAALRENYGMVVAAIVGLALMLPIFGFLSKFLVDKLVGSIFAQSNLT